MVLGCDISLTILLTSVDILATLLIDKRQSKESTVSRLQLALNVSDLNEAVEFYSKFFKTEPVKIRPGYANFAIADPPLKLVLFENPGEPGTINHLGVEVFSTDEVVGATQYLTEQGFATHIEEQTTCCYAVQDKVWVDGPDGSRWEVYTVLNDASDTSSPTGGETCCSPTSLTMSEAAPCC
jgi:catechol 2,3-dioxygenase-like lactoylglutathione lyase family enzyme